MSRNSAIAFNARTALAACCALALVFSLLPARLTPFIPWLSGLLDLTIAPVQRPATGLVRVLRGPQPGRPTDEHVRALEADRDLWALRAAQADVEIESLRRQIVALQRGLALNPQEPFRQRQATVIGFGVEAGSTLLKVQAGERDGVTTGGVATFDGVNLVGRVTRVDSRTCRVTPITDKGAGGLGARVFAPEAPSAPGAAGAPSPLQSLECKLSPDGRGRLIGPVEWTGLRPDQVAMKPAPGMIVRLADAPPAWPAHAQMLVVGVVEDVRTSDVGRTTIIVKPAFDLQRVSEVTLRLSGEERDGGTPGAGAGGPPR